MAVAESFFGRLKKERIKKHIYKNRELARADVADYIDTFYNRTHRRNHLGGVSPEQFELAERFMNVARLETLVPDEDTERVIELIRKAAQLARTARLAQVAWLCDNVGETPMRGLILLIVLLSLVAAPVAMAVDGCSGMGSVCGASCSAPCASTPTATAGPILLPVANLAPVVLARVPGAVLQAPDAPPRPLLSA